MNTLYRFDDCLSLNIDQTTKLYNSFVNPGQVNLINTFSFGQDIISKAQGCYLYTQSGKKILDMTGGKGVLNHGHNHPRILNVRKRFQDQELPEVHKTHLSPFLAALSSNIAKLLPGNLEKSYFVNSGSEAVDGALKMAYKFHKGKRKYALHSDISFHGKLIGAGSFTASEEVTFNFPKLPYTKTFSYNDIQSVKDRINELKVNNYTDIYAIILEPFSAGSLEKCDESFLKELRKLCTEHDIILIYDEVYTGWAKTGELFYFMHFDNVSPDILTFSKSFGGGKASISGYTATNKVFKYTYGNTKDAILHSTTYNGFGEECATALEAINIIVEDQYSARAIKIEEHIKKELEYIQERYDCIKEVKGVGAHYGFTLNYAEELKEFARKNLPDYFSAKARTLEKIITASIVEELYSKHNILVGFGSNKGIPLLISPSLVITDEELDHFFSALRDTLVLGLNKLTSKLVLHKLKTSL